jgi:hypothetical protein
MIQLITGWILDYGLWMFMDDYYLLNFIDIDLP